MEHTSTRYMNILPILSIAIVSSAVLTASNTGRVLQVDVPAVQEVTEQPSNYVPLSIENQIKRLQKRVAGRFGAVPSESATRRALVQRRMLLGHTANVAFSGLTDLHAAPWTLSLSQHPDWIVFDSKTMSFGIDEALVLASLDAQYPMGMEKVVHATVESTYDDKGVLHANLNATPKDGYVLDTAKAAQLISEAFAKQQDSVTLDIQFQKGTITKDGQVLSLLSTGMSEYSGSPWGRIQNVKKEVKERLNGSVAVKGETFSFNETFGGPVSLGNGWYNSLIIVNGKDLEQAPGGGICQAATTTYRAVVLAGLPVVARNNHSLYVTHYKKYGIGIDATVFPKKQDMSFINDTPADIVILASMDEEKQEVTVKFYGVSDGRTVDLQGPYFGPTAPEWLKVNDRAVRNNEVVWNQAIRFADGRVTNNVIVSDFVGLPYHKLSKEFPTSVGIADLVPAPAPKADIVAEGL